MIISANRVQKKNHPNNILTKLPSSILNASYHVSPRSLSIKINNTYNKKNPNVTLIVIIVSSCVQGPVGLLS